MQSFIPQEFIRKKREGGTLTTNEWRAFFDGYLAQEVADYQMSAMLMASFFRGMTIEETKAVTELMRDSGDVMSWPDKAGQVVDKHSTGGVGDKTSLVLLPLCVLEGVSVPMISGRGLGHTGGTLDKLEAIHGMNVRLGVDEARRVMDKFGGAFMGQTDKVAPLDRRLYSLRDVTATVESIPLITASILSKKLAEGLSGLCMDVKCGSGAFMSSRDDARALAKSLHTVGTACGLSMSCLITDMDSPLGRTAGNGVEVYECVAMMRGESTDARLRELVLELATEMVQLVAKTRTRAEIRASLEGHLRSGAAFERFCKIVAAQGGSTQQLDHPELFLKASVQMPVLIQSREDQVVRSIDVRNLGIAVQFLGGGRTRVDQSIDHDVGLTHLKHVGDTITAGEPLAIVHARNNAEASEACKLISSSYKLEKKGGPSAKQPLILERIS